MITAFILGITLPILLAAAFLLGRHLHRRQPGAGSLSPVSRQHIHLFQGAPLNESVVETFRVRYQELLACGQTAAVEASLRPGIDFVFQVRALAEIGTDQAGCLLERQLQRRLTEDPLEQFWYWIDLASSLRLLNRQESLPHLLRCAENNAENPLGQFFAAETIGFLGFASYLRQPDTPLGRSALRLLHRVLEGLRFELPPHVVTDSRMGEMIETLWDYRPDEAHPLIVLITQAVLRLLRRQPHAHRLVTEEAVEQEAYIWQMSRLAGLEPALIEYQERAAIELQEQLATSRGPQRLDILQALTDLRADAGATLLPLLERSDNGFFSELELELAIDLLTWSKNMRVGPWLRNYAIRQVPMSRRILWRKRPLPPRKPSLAANIPYGAILRSLRGHPSIETEAFLMQAARDWDPTYRQAACSSFGWWEPMQRTQVVGCLHDCRADPSPEVRKTARAALARLGERQALYWFRHALTAEDSDNVHDAIHTIGVENLFLLWPDLDRLADSENLDIAHHARETLENLSEDMDRSRDK
jgi:hypothetical protein